MLRCLVLVAATVAASGSAFAQTTLHFREGQRVEPQEVRRILDNVPAPTRSRSIRLLDDPPADAGGAERAPAPSAAPSALSLPVRFEFDSSVISASGREQLDALAQGLRLLPPQRLVIIEGHTDASGAEAYNEQLSQRRAAAVKRYLVDEHGIDPARLREVGFGKRRPIDGADPFAGENRRVQFRGA